MNHKAPVEIDWQTRQQIAKLAAFFGCIAAVMLALKATGDTRPNPLVVGLIAGVLSFVASLMHRGIGIGIIALGSLLILGACGTCGPAQ